MKLHVKITYFAGSKIVMKELGLQGYKLTLKRFDLSKIWARKFRHFLTKFMEIHFFLLSV